MQCKCPSQSLIGFDLVFDAATSHLNVPKASILVITKIIHASWQLPRSGFENETPKKTRALVRTDSAPQDPGCLTSGSAPVILVEGAVSRADFAEEVVADSDPETADCMDRAVVSQRNESSRGKFPWEVKTSPTQSLAGLGIVVTKQVRAKATFPVKGVWFDTLEEAQSFCTSHAFLLQFHGWQMKVLILVSNTGQYLIASTSSAITRSLSYTSPAIVRSIVKLGRS